MHDVCTVRDEGKMKLRELFNGSAFIVISRDYIYVKIILTDESFLASAASHFIL